MAGGAPHPGRSERFISRSEDETRQAGRRLALRLKAGDVIVLTGPLGAGKTVLVRGLAEGLGIDTRQVHSPSYTMVSEYGPSPSGLLLVHADLYRIDVTGEIEELGLGDSLSGPCVLAVEWGEKLPARLRAGAWRVTLDPVDDAAAAAESRSIVIDPPGAQLSSPSQ